jgi:hypothetical protein
MSNVVGQIYSGAADLGRVYAIIGVVIGTLIGIAMIVGGSYVLYKKDPFTASVTGKVVSRSCFASNCSIGVTYNVNGIAYNAGFTVAIQDPYVVGSSITVWYDPSNPNSSEVQRLPHDVLGWGLIVGGVVIIALVWFTLFLSRRYKFFAAAEGAYGTYRLF